MILSKRGQSIFEYILLLTIVIIVCLAILGPNGLFKEKFGSSLNLAIDSLEGIVNTIEY